MGNERKFQVKAIKLHKFPPQLKFLVQFRSHARETPSRLKYCPLFSLTYIFPHTFTYAQIPKRFFFLFARLALCLSRFLSFAGSIKKRVHAPINEKKTRFVIRVEQKAGDLQNGSLCEFSAKEALEWLDELTANSHADKNFAVCFSVGSV